MNEINRDNGYGDDNVSDRERVRTRAPVGEDVSRRKFRIKISKHQGIFQGEDIFKRFFPIPETQLYMQQAEWLEAEVTVSLSENGILHGPAEMNGYQRIEFYTDVPEDSQEQYKPEPFRVTANFDRDQLDGDFVSYVTHNDKLWSLDQILYRNGKIAVVMSIDTDSGYLSFNSLVKQIIYDIGTRPVKEKLFLEPNGPINIEKFITVAYPQLNIGVPWHIKILAAETIFTTIEFSN